MALLENCPTCGNSTSENSTVCPKCGEPFEKGWAQEIRAKRKAEEDAKNEREKRKQLEEEEQKTIKTKKQNKRIFFLLFVLWAVIWGKSTYLSIFEPEHYEEIIAAENAKKEYERQAEIKKLKVEVAKIPVSNFRKNADIYKRLNKLEPDNVIFLEKYTFYKQKQEELDKVREKQREQDKVKQEKDNNLETRKLTWIEVGKDAVRARLKDADSAKFRNTFFNYAVLEGKKVPVSCGEVNSKNGFGAYNGFTRYVSAGEGLTFLESDVVDFGNVWSMLCRK